MKTILVGLGNPGSQFNHTRHNAGFMALDVFLQKNDFPEFSVQKKSNSLVSQKDTVVLVKPQTFMNESGKSVAKIFTKSDTLVVVHDDIDLPLGKIKWSKDSSSGGHKGVSSIIESIGTQDFIRLKIGIATNNAKALDVVLKKFSPQEQELLEKVIETSAESLQYFLLNGLEKTMNEFNR